MVLTFFGASTAITYPLQQSVALDIVRIFITITLPVILVFVTPPLLGIILVGFVVLIGCYLLLSPFLSAFVLALTFGTILLIGYVSIYCKHLPATGTFSAHFEPPGYYDQPFQGSTSLSL
jgi:hypothetical protein